MPKLHCNKMKYCCVGPTYIVIIQTLVTNKTYCSISMLLQHQQIESELQSSTLDHYNLALDWWARIVSMVEMGTLCPELWMDVSLIIMRKIKLKQVKLDTLTFLKPFTTSVWILILFAIMLIALVYYCIDFMACEGNNE